MKIVAEIPVRLGSKRVPKKNIRLICGKPMVGYAVEACRESTLVDEVYINSEAEELRCLAHEYGVHFYQRSPELAEDHVVQDEFNYDFLTHIDCDVLVMVNPVSPLVLAEDIDDAIRFFEAGSYDTVISVREERLQSFYQAQPVNFNVDEKLPMTQNLDPIQLCSWTVCVWRADRLRAHFEEHGFGVFVGQVGLYPFNAVRSLKVSTEMDFQLAEVVIEARNRESVPPQYYGDGESRDV